MKLAIVVFTLMFARPESSKAQEHLTPETGLLTGFDRYHHNIREYFEAARKEAAKSELVCQVTIIASFQPEEYLAIHKTEQGHEVFSIKLASPIWDFESIRMRESNQSGFLGKDGKPVPLDQDEAYQKLKKRAPADFRLIKNEVKATPIDDALAKRIAKIWERMILASHYPKRLGRGFDGATYHFSMWVQGRGLIDGQTWSPDEKTKAGELVDLTYALLAYSGKGMGVEQLKKILERVEKATAK